MKKFAKLFLSILCIIQLIGCTNHQDRITLHIAAAASLKNCMEEIYTAYQKENENVVFEGIYDGSGKLQVQIEQGLEADLFFSAATQQMDALVEENLVEESSVINLLENKLVLVTNCETDVTGIENINKAETIAIGDPESVPAGQYAQIALKDQYDSLQSKLSLGTNVSEVLAWSEAGSAEVGIVYKTDTINHNVRILQEIDLDNSIMYPVGIVKSTKNKEESLKFLEFLKSEKAKHIFEKYGFEGV